MLTNPTVPSVLGVLSTVSPEAPQEPLMPRSLLTPWATPLRVARALSRWPVDSQLHARRNALVASTELAARTHERRQVDEYLAGHARRWAAEHPVLARHRA
jgi:hypothetical protein